MNAIVRGIAGTAFLLSLGTACASQSNETLVFRIEQALVTSAGGADFGNLVGGDWDRVCVFRAGTGYERVDSVLGAPWPASGETGIETRDDAALLVFARGATVVEHVLYPVVKGDFGTPGPEQWYCRPRTRAVFELRRPIDGSIPWIGPVSTGGGSLSPAP